jgi:hypothetical protein
LSVTPEYKKQANLVPLNDRWKCDTDWIDRANDPDHNRLDMDNVIISLAKTFIPAVPCSCSKDTPKPPPHGEWLYVPTLSHNVTPNYQFALRDTPMMRAVQERIGAASMVDLDETSSVTEYCSVFEQALRSEYEEHLRLYELYSLYHFHIELLDKHPHPVIPCQDYKEARQAAGSFVYKTARLVIDGISDARPTLQIGDIVLLRPIPAYDQVHVEIESRIVRVIRGQTNRRFDASQGNDHFGKDQVIITWGLNHKQTSYLLLKHLSKTSLRKTQKKGEMHKTSEHNIMFNVRFIPSAAVLERCLTALDWLSHVSKNNPQALDDVLFPVKAPAVKPLSAHQMHRMKEDYSDEENPLNELQSSFVKMVGARTRDPEYNNVRPPMILTGPAGRFALSYYKLNYRLYLTFISFYIRDWQDQDSHGCNCRCSGHHVIWMCQ